MAYSSLPPVYERWNDDDIAKNLTVEEAERLHLWMHLKLHQIENYIEYQTFFAHRKHKKRK